MFQTVVVLYLVIFLYHGYNEAATYILREILVREEPLTDSLNGNEMVNPRAEGKDYFFFVLKFFSLFFWFFIREPPLGSFFFIFFVSLCYFSFFSPTAEILNLRFYYVSQYLGILVFFFFFKIFFF